MIEKLEAGTVEEGKAHPFVEALVKDLRARHGQRSKLLEARSAAGAAHAELAGIGGRCAELREIIDLIAKVEGVEE